MIRNIIRGSVVSVDLVHGIKNRYQQRKIGMIIGFVRKSLIYIANEILLNEDGPISLKQNVCLHGYQYSMTSEGRWWLLPHNVVPASALNQSNSSILSNNHQGLLRSGII